MKGSIAITSFVFAA
ncbi:uncharacterized protein FFB20_11245 [Fusarium fujikuroi]|nr:uncharacterized protein FFE2_08954 [Fusarium fujikuroi]SCO00534.1 uncharacterized protein FFB20_11245 [Fusarium fujikuroi]SCO07169.1 uncharacterized protein FFC1_10342 [Fusarium fujikuroi]SCO44670.1 uncharacterized protein FFNC_09971 [Fusarium fujikuroi]SCO57715.1 uncharacterized protein FFMR_14871 [Fusarium fujikuroi]